MKQKTTHLKILRVSSEPNNIRNLPHDGCLLYLLTLSGWLPSMIVNVNEYREFLLNGLGFTHHKIIGIPIYRRMEKPLKLS